jgi:hypothetical protein
MEMQGLKQAAMRPSEAFGTTKEFIWKQPEKPKPLKAKECRDALKRLSKIIRRIDRPTGTISPHCTPIDGWLDCRS